MAKLQTLLLLALLFGTSIGCGKSGGPAAHQSTGSLTTGTQPNNPIAQVVHQFLDAVRQGNTEGASRLLTPLALQRTSEMELNFSPPGSSTAKFSVGEVEMIDDERAIVRSVWSDLDADGVASNEQITWALKRSADQWRISGMAAEVAENEPPVVMDFENPGELLEPKPPATAAQDAPRQANIQAQDPFQPSVPR